MEGALLERLASRLAAIGIRPKPRPLAELLATFEERRSLARLAQLLTTFVRHSKERRLEVDTLKAVASDPRTRCFLKIADQVYRKYEQQLAVEQSIDFQDMIRLATDAIEAKRAPRHCAYVLVDECQDLSHGRAQLLKALLAQTPGRRLTCVGDDWQSIYQFAGSDVTLMTAFTEHFGHAATVMLDETFRFGQALVDASATFISRNPAQRRKKIRSWQHQHLAPVVLCASARPPARDPLAIRDSMANDIRMILRRIDGECSTGEQIRVCLLGRYNHSLPVSDAHSLADGLSRLQVEFNTVHRAKGLEADYIVVLDVNTGKHGFPSEIVDDPLLALVLAQPESYPHAEERRLFYVALTRARRRVFVLTSETRQSVFVDELLGQEYAALVDTEGAFGTRVPCGDCGGVLVERVRITSGRKFWACVNYPYCKSASKACRLCQRGTLVRRGLRFRCSNPACKNQADICPRCGEGYLERRPHRQRGHETYRCSRWRSDGTGCNYPGNLLRSLFARRGQRSRR
jgi:DNA helicase-4